MITKEFTLFTNQIPTYLFDIRFVINELLYMSLFTYQNVNKHLILIIEPHPHQKTSAWRYTRKQMQRNDRSNSWTQTAKEKNNDNIRNKLGNYLTEF